MSQADKRAAVASVGIEESSAEVNDQTIHYLRAGTGPVLVLVHGYPESSETWRKVMPELAKHFTVIAPDTRGVGQSSVADNFSLEDVANDVYELVKALGFKKVFLVGQDFGVPVVSAYAAKHREDVSALVVIESPLPAFGLEELFGSFWHFGFMASPFAEMLIAGKEKEFFHGFAFGAFVFAKRPSLQQKSTITFPTRCVLGDSGQAWPTTALFLQAKSFSQRRSRHRGPSQCSRSIATTR